MKNIRLLIYYSLPPFNRRCRCRCFCFHTEAKQHSQKSARTTFVRDLKREPYGKTTKIEHAHDNRL